MTATALQSSPPSGPDTAIELFGLTQERLQLLKNTVARGTTDDEFQLFVHVCKTRKIDPFSKLIYPVKRWDKKVGAEVMALQSSIDYFRLSAERTGHYAGQRGPQWCGLDGAWVDVWLQKGPPAAARVGILRKDFAEPLWSIALWTNYAQTDKQGNLTSFWARMGPLMLAKCAEALGLRRAFPEDLAGLYVGEEMEQAESPAPQLAPVEVRPKGLDELAGQTAQERAEFAEVIDNGTGEVLAMPTEGSPEELTCVERHRARLVAKADPSTFVGEAARDRDAFVRYQIREGEREAAERKAKKSKAEPPPVIHSWHPDSESVLETCLPVSCGAWGSWCDEELPKGKLHAITANAGAATWRTLAKGKKGGARHNAALEILAGFQKANPKAKAKDVPVSFQRLACTLAVLLEGREAQAAEAQTQTTAESLFE